MCLKKEIFFSPIFSQILFSQNNIMLSRLIVIFQRFLSFISDFVFVGSKSIITPKRRPIVTAVERIYIPEYNIRGFVYSPRPDIAGEIRKPFSCFPNGLKNVMAGRLQYYHAYDERSRIEDLLMRLFVWFCASIPEIFLPKVRNCFEFVSSPSVPADDESQHQLPLIVWSHGRGGNAWDHAWLCSELASQVPAIVVSVTHTDGTADFFQRVQQGRTSVYQHLKASVQQDEKFLEQLMEMREYQIRYRSEELMNAIQFVRDTYNHQLNDKVILGGFEMGATTAVAMATKFNNKLNVTGIVSLDGLFCIEDRFAFPREVFTECNVKCPIALVLSDDWSVWNKPVAENSQVLFEETGSRTGDKTRIITLKQTNHLNLTECMYWVPQLFVRVLRLSGIVHRRGDPRKTYRRLSKWLVSVVAQYTNDQSGFRASEEL